MAELTQFGVEFQVEGIVRAQQSFDQLSTSGDRASTSIDRFGSSAQTSMVKAAALGSVLAQGLQRAVAEVANMFRSVVELGAELQDLSDITGMSIEALDEYSLIAKLNGASTKDLVTVHKELSRTMVEAQNPTSKTAALFRELGLSVADLANKSEPERIKAVADALSGIADDATRTAVGVELLGKSYVNLAATLKNWEEDQKRAQEVLEEFGPISAYAASRADALGDTITLLGEGFQRAFLNAIVPALTAMEIAMNSSTKETASFSKGLGELVNWILTKGTEAFIVLGAGFKQIGVLIAGIFAAISERSVEPLKMAWEDAKRIEAEARQTVQNIRTATELAGNDADAMVRAKEAADAEAKAKTNLRGIQAALNSERDKEVKLISSTLKEMKMPEFTALKENPFTKKFGDDFKSILKTLREFTKEYNEWQTEFESKRAGGPATPEAVRQLEKFREIALALRDTAGGTEEEYARINWWLDEWIPKSIELAYQNEEIKKQVEATADAAKRAAEEQKRVAEEIGNSLTDALLRGFESGKGFAKNFVDTLKNMFRTLVLRPVIQAIMAPVGNMMSGFVGGITNGMSGGSGIPGMPSLNLGGYNPFGSGFSLSGNSFGGYASQSYMYGPGEYPEIFSGAFNSSFQSGLTSALGGAAIGGTVGMLGASLFGNSRNSKYMSIGGTVGGAIGGAIFGPIGALIGSVLGTAVGSLFKSGGGAKTGGFGTAGTVPSDLARFFTPNQKDSEMRTLSGSLQDSLQAALSRFGISATSGFASSFDADPKGTAGSRIGLEAFLNGQSVYSVRNLDVGRDEAAIEAALKLEGQRAILAALKAADLSEAVKAVLGTVDAATALEEDIEDVINLAEAFANLSKVISGDIGEDAAEAIRLAGLTAYGAFMDSAEGLNELIDAFDGTIETTTALTEATAQYRAAGIQLLVQIEQLRTAITGPQGLFANLIRDLTFQTLNPQGQYDFLREQTRLLETELLTTNDPARINAIAAQLNDYYRQAFGMLSADEQRSILPQFISEITGLTTTVNERLDAARDDVQTALQGALDTITNKLDAVVDKMADSATSQQNAAEAQTNAANTQLRAANTPVQVNVRLDSGLAYNVNGG